MQLTSPNVRFSCRQKSTEPSFSAELTEQSASKTNLQTVVHCYMNTIVVPVNYFVLVRSVELAAWPT